MGIKWFQLVDEAGAAKAEVDYVSVDTAIVPMLRKAVKAEYADTLLADTPSVKLVVYANRADFGAKCAPLGYGDSIASLGESLNDPLIVQTPPASSDVCLECAVYGEGIVFPVAIAREAKVSALQKAIVKEKEQVNSRFKVDPSAIMLFLAKDANGAWLKHDDSLETLLRHDVNSQCKKMLSSLKLTHYFDEEFSVSVNGGEVHILVKLPESPSASYTSAVLMPPMAPLENAEELCNECAAVPTWQPGVVHSIQHLHAFMKPLGGCTQRGEVYWREEEKQIATLLGEWFPASGGDTFADKRIVLKGSPGVGKSTMFCLIAMYVAIVKKKNVLVVRKVAGVFYVFFVGHDSDQVVCFSKQDCAVEDAVAVLRKLKENHRDFPSVCLMLDGFVYEVIPAGLKVSHLLATSQQVRLKNEVRALTKIYLFPSWRSGDLFLLGKSIYEWSDDVMNKRFYYSGGSVRDFTLEDADQIRIQMLDVVTEAPPDPFPLLRCSRVVSSSKDQIDRLRRTFVKRKHVGNPLAYLDPSLWEQVVDSAFVITELRNRKQIRDKDIFSVYHWARARGSNSAALAGLLFELVIHHLAADNTLQLSTTPYHKLEFRQPDAPKSLQFTQLSMKKGGSVETEDDKLEKSLVDWKNDDTYSYWRPSRQNFNTIDSIVKLTEGGVAYLQMTVSNKHPVNVAFLKTLNGILGEEKPKFIVVCPTFKAAKRFVLGTRAVVTEALTVCDVHVAYYGEAGIDPKMDGPRNNVPLPSPPPPPPPYNLRSRHTADGDHTLMQDTTTLSSRAADGEDTVMQDTTTLSSVDDDDESMDSTSSSDDE